MNHTIGGTSYNPSQQGVWAVGHLESIQHIKPEWGGLRYGVRARSSFEDHLIVKNRSLAWDPGREVSEVSFKRSVPPTTGDLQELARTD